MKHYFEVKLTYIEASGETVKGTYLTQAESIVKATPAVIRRLRVPSGSIIWTSAEFLESNTEFLEKNQQRFLLSSNKTNCWRVRGKRGIDWIVRVEEEEQAIGRVKFELRFDLKPCDNLKAAKYTRVLL